MLLALTFEAAEPIAARGAIAAFWKAYREAFGKRPYFSWAELQFRGAVHYHAILVSPPWKMRRRATRWIEAHWPHARIQPSIQFRDDRWFRENSGRYVRKYASEKHREHQELGHWGPTLPVDKSYQQEYDALPREIRTWECNRLEHSSKAIGAHLDQPDIVWLKPMAPWPERAQHVWLVGLWRHETPSWRRCTLAEKKPPLRIVEEVGAAPRKDYGVTTTAGSLSE